jgi:PhzF family phenazine biosynthesis protein
MQIALYQVDAFTSELFHGNPAAVCPLEEWLPDETLQAIAAENNLSETAFYVTTGKRRRLRWFTPGVEVDLCGHATLATAYVVLEIRRETSGPRVEFETKSGELMVEREGDLYALDFPARPPEPCETDPKLVAALGARPKFVAAARDFMCVFENEDQVRALTPNMEKLAALDRFACIVTAPGRDCDFVSRFFAPARGVPEDPVTGSSHCTLIPYWSKRLGKTKLFARQLSRRGGELWCEDRGERVKIAGRAVKFLEGSLEVRQQIASTAS